MTTTTVLDQRFELQERVFSEGNQAAYLARDLVRNEDVLLFLVPPRKKLTAEDDRALTGDLARAFDVAAPSLLPVQDLRITEDYRFLVMPRPEGANAWGRITSKSGAERLDFAGVRAVADDLILAAKAAHAHGTLLGCSPKQVWIRPGGGADVQYFWIGRGRGGGSEGDTGGTDAVLESTGVEGAYFRAPELADGGHGPIELADQYFISAILYGLVTGEVPGGRLAPVRRARKDAPAPLAKAIEKALAPDPKARHADLDRFRTALYRQTPRVGFVAPLVLLLAALVAGRALFQGGATADSWALSARVEAERAAAFAAATPRAKELPEASAELRARLAGRYESTDGVALVLLPDGTFHLGDRRRENPRRTRGIWWQDPAAPEALVLGASLDETGPPWARRVEIQADALQLTATPDDPSSPRLRKVAWHPGGDAPLAPLVVLELPLEGRTLPERVIAVRGRVAQPRTKVTINGVAVPVTGTGFEHTFDAPAGARGPVQVLVEAVAPDGFQASVTRTVVIDAGPPTLAFTRTTLEEREGVWQLTIEGTVSDDGAITSLRVNDEPVEPGPDGTFRYERRGVDALAHAFAEAVATDDVGRSTLRVAWPTILAVPANSLDARVAEARKALQERRIEDAERLLRALRKDGGLLEQIVPEEWSRLVRGARTPRLSLDAYPQPPRWFENDGTREITLEGSVEWFGPEDTLLAGGRIVEVRDGRFSARVQLPGIGPQTVPLQIHRAGETLASREVEVWLAAADAGVEEMLGVPLTPQQRKASAEFGLPLTYENSQGMRFVLLPPGAVPRTTSGGQRFDVLVTKPFYLQTTEVTREQYEKVLGGKDLLPSEFATESGIPIPVGGTRRPAQSVSRDEAVAFAAKLSRTEGGTYRLPTEAQWEFGARGGDRVGRTYWGAQVAKSATWANFADRSIRTVVPKWPAHLFDAGVDDGAPGTWEVGKGRPNAYGLRDMLGNVAEWVADGYSEFNGTETEDAFVAPARRNGIHRGGGWRQLPATMDFSTRTEAPPTLKEAWLGFRLVYVPEGR